MSKKKRIEIKHCPFCGGPASTFHIPENEENNHPKWQWNYPGMWVIGCNTDGCFGNINHFTMIFANEENAIKTWNKRYIDDFGKFMNEPKDG